MHSLFFSQFALAVFAAEAQGSDILIAAGIAVVVGFLLALIPTSVMKREASDNVKAATDADSYEKDGAFKLIVHDDTLVDRKVFRAEKPKDNNGQNGEPAAPGGKPVPPKK